ncbi:MAG: fibronectin type III domain-containing protein, partial [Bacteroidales bacterium]
MKKIALLWAGIFLFSMQAKALNEPTLVCMEVRNNGELQITWIKPTDTLNFSHYVIYYSVSESGPFLTQQITATDVASCVIIGTDAITNPVYYCYMSAVSLSGQEYFSQTLHTIDFTVTPNYENGTALLRWDAPMNPLPSSFATTYTVFKKEPGDLDFSMLATTPNTVTHSIDMVDVCHDTVSYFVQILNRLTDYNCYYKSRVQKDSVVDKTPPNIPVLTLVTVNYDTQQIQLDWEVSGDANAYIIYWEDDTGLWVDVDTVVGETSWIDPVHDPRLKVQRYRIAAIDPCFNSTSITDPQRTMMLVVDYQDACRREAKLSWTAYQNMQGGIEKYEIYVSVNGAALQYLSEVSANNTSYIATDLETNQTYCFVVAAVNNGAMAKAYSTKTCFEFVEDETADFAYIRYVSVENNHHIAIKVFTSGDTLPFKKIELYRSVNTMNHFTLFSAQTYNGTAHYTFIDSTADVQTTLYYYKSLIINSCDAVATESNTAHNILLQGEATAQQNTSRWNEYAT